MSFLKRYQVHLTVIGPVFIGSGKSIGKKEWILDRQAKSASMIDQKNLFTMLQQKGLLESYEKFMLGQNKSFDEWAKEQKLSEADINSVTKYELDSQGISDINTLKEIKTFIKDAYGLPYVPGSSLKGTLRNIILAKMISDRRFNSDKVKSEVLNPTKRGKNYLRNESNAIQTLYFNTLNRDEKKKSSAVNDIMSGIRISDSRPLQLSDLTLCQKIDITLEDKENEHQVIRESLKTGTEIYCEMTIDTKQCKLNTQWIETAINDFLEQYNKMFLSHFKSEEQFADNVIYLGGGVGFASKTVTGQVFQNDKDRVKLTAAIIDQGLPAKIKEKHHHAKDAGYGVSPHVVKLTDVGGSLLQFGPCRIEFAEIAE